MNGKVGQTTSSEHAHRRPVSRLEHRQGTGMHESLHLRSQLMNQLKAGSAVVESMEAEKLAKSGKSAKISMSEQAMTLQCEATDMNPSSTNVDEKKSTRERLSVEEVEKLHQDLLSWVNVKEDSVLHVHEMFTTKQKVNDLDALVSNFTAPALARALRDREETLVNLARLAEKDDLTQLKQALLPFLQTSQSQTSDPGAALSSVGSLGKTRRRDISFGVYQDNLCDGEGFLLPDLGLEGGLFQEDVLERMKYRLNRIPREIATRSSRRACVVIPLCLNEQNEASVLFTLRANNLRRHKGEICFPGGMLDKETDQNIIKAGLREMEEEIGVAADHASVLGILRCDWAEVKAITGVAVTPVIGYLGSINNLKLKLNPGEVSKFFTVPITELVDKQNWNNLGSQTNSATVSTTAGATVGPVFTQRMTEQQKRSSHLEGGHAKDSHRVWGLTGYLLYRFTKLLPSVVFENYRSVSSVDR